MSQGDYIQLKKTKQVLTQQLSPVISHEDYTSFKNYHLETTVDNAKNTFSRLLPASNTDIFDMELSVAECPTFLLCTNTHERTNRKLNVFLVPNPTKRLNKMSDPLKPCVLRQGHVERAVYCDRKVCKCGIRDPLYRPPYNSR